MPEQKLPESIQRQRERVLGAVEAVRGTGRGVELLAEAAVSVTEALLLLSREFEDRTDREQRLQLARMVDDPEGCAFTTLFTDRVPRALTPGASVRTGQQLLRQLGVPIYFGQADRIMLRAFGAFARLQPTVSASAVNRYIRQETSRYLLPDESSELNSKLSQMKRGGIQINLNHLGEEILSAEEAEAHLQAYERLLVLPEVDTVSVKISSVCERLSSLAFEDSLERISAALRRVYRAAVSTSSHKLVMLDMEAYKDLELSVAAFTRVADEPEFRSSRVGIVLQAYIPDSHNVQDELLNWAKRRVEAGGHPVRIRLVKGANLAMEQVLEEQRGWPNPVYSTKAEVDASFKRMLEKATRAEHAHYLIQGVASHNLFDVALTMLLRSSLGGESHVSFEILSGMAEPLKRTLALLEMKTLIYCPTVAKDSYHTAVAYLVRRLDENTTPGNFLCSGFGMELGDSAWHQQKAQFLQAAADAKDVGTESRRTAASGELGQAREVDEPFANENDTYFCVAAERRRLNDAIATVHARSGRQLQLSIAGQWVTRAGTAGFDPSLPAAEPYQTSMATERDIESVLSSGDAARQAVLEVPVRERARWLLAAAAKFRDHRFELVALIMQDGGKIAAEADSEVSEAIDFAEYYARLAVEHNEWRETRLRPRGLSVVTPPWNFPFAIPLGGCFAALAMGNPVVLKPAPETPSVATRAVELCYEAGIPQEFLQLVVATDAIATPLITDPRVQTVILTGASDTARLFKRLRPDIHLLAETGGKNTLIVTEYADIDAAVAATADSAFGHSGQKCSAASLLIVQEQVVKRSQFLERLKEATCSRRVGSVWDLASDQGPLIHPPSGALLDAINSSQTESNWLVRPEVDADNPRLLRPGIRKDVQTGSLLHKTELFGPVLGIMVAKDLHSAIHLANDTPYGLTSGLMSLDEQEQRTFCQRMDAGNLYVNRATTGAIVRRQPFGGRKTSSFGPGAKAGGPNYTLETVHVSERRRRLDGADLPPALNHQLDPICQSLPKSQHSEFWAAAQSYQLASRDHFTLNHDPSALKSQRNVFRYQPAEEVLLWMGRKTEPFDLALVLAALAHCQVRFDLAMLEPTDKTVKTASLLGPSLRKVVGRLDPRENNAVRLSAYRLVRCIGEFPAEIHSAKNGVDAYFEMSAPLHFGRIELLRYFQEQSVSAELHRYGNLQGATLSPLGHN